jgi:hypothetical protein
MFVVCGFVRYTIYIIIIRWDILNILPKTKKKMLIHRYTWGRNEISIGYSRRNEGNAFIVRMQHNNGKTRKTTLRKIKMIYGGGSIIIVCYLSQDLQHTRTPVTLLLGYICTYVFCLVLFFGGFCMWTSEVDIMCIWRARVCVCLCLLYTLIYMYRRNRHAISNRKGH